MKVSKVKTLPSALENIFDFSTWAVVSDHEGDAFGGGHAATTHCCVIDLTQNSNTLLELDWER